MFPNALKQLVDFQLIYLQDVHLQVLYLQGNESAEEHTVYVWDHVISKCEAKRIDIVAHSYGGVAVLDLVS